MARPRATIFYEIPLPQTLLEKEKWLPDYHKYSEMLMCYLVKRGAQSSVYHTAIRCLTELNRQGMAGCKPGLPNQWDEG